MMRNAKAALPGRSGSDRRNMLDMTNAFRLKHGSKKNDVKDSVVDVITDGAQTITDINKTLKMERELNQEQEKDNG